jgi:hypothetical protein
MIPKRPLFGAALAAMVLPAWVGAQAPATLAELRQRWTIEVPASGDARDLLLPRALPALNASTPSGFGAGGGQFFVGVGYQAETRASIRGGSSGRDDGALVLGGGLGDPNRIALELAYTSFSTVRSGFGERGGLSLKLHRQFANGIALAVGRERAVVVGSRGDGGAANFAAASKLIPLRGNARSLFSTLALTVGAGDGRFRRADDIEADRSRVRPFAAVALRVIEPLGVTADWNGQALTAAVSVVPLRCLPLVITPGWTDLAGDDALTSRFTLGMGLALSGRTLHTLRNTPCF